MAENESNVTLRYLLDQQSLQGVMQGSDALIAKQNELSDATDQVSQSASNAASAIQSALPDASAYQAMADALKQTNDQWQQIGDSIQADTDKIKAFQAQQDELTRQSVAQQTGYGVEGGMIGPAAPPADDGSGDDGGGGFRPYGLARGLRVAGFATKSPILSEAGGAIYIQQALSSLTPVAKQAADAIGLTEASMGDLLVIAPELVVALAAFVAVAKTFSDELSAAKASFDNALSSVDAYYKAVEDGTTASIQASLTKLEVEKQINADELQFLQQQQDNAGKAFAQSSEGQAALKLLGPQIFALIEPSNAFNGKLKDLKDNLDKSQAAIDGETRALNSNTVAMNDARDAAEKQFAQQVDNNLRITQDEVSWSEKRLKLIQDGNVAAIQAEIQKDEQQKNIQEGAIARLKGLEAGIADPALRAKYDAAINNYQVSNDELAGQIRDLTDNVLGLAAASAAAGNAVKGVVDFLSKGLPDGVKNIEDTFSKLADNQAKFNTSEADKAAAFKTKQQQEQQTFDDKIADDKKKNDAKIAKETTALYAEVDKITAKANDEELKARQTLVDKTAQINQDLADKIAAIQDKTRQDELDAASHLDARKIAELQRQEAQQINSATAAADKQKTQLEKETETKVKELKKSAEEERAQRLAQGLQKIQDEDQQFKDQQQQEIEDFNTKMQNERDNEARADAQRVAAFNDQQAALRDHLGKLLGIQNNGQGLIRDAWSQLMTDITNLTKNIQIPAQTVTTAQYQAAQATAPDAYSQFQTPYAAQPAPSVTTSQYQSASAGSPDAYSQLLGNSANTGSYNSLTNLATAGMSVLGGIGHLFGFAGGGYPSPGQSFVAGENGPEIIRLRSGGQVYNNSDTSRMAGGKTVYVENINITGTNMSPEQLEDAIAGALQREADR